MVKKTLIVLLVIALVSFLISLSSNFFFTTWALVFLSGGYSFGLINFKVFLLYINAIFLIIFGVSSVLFIVKFYKLYGKERMVFWRAKRKKIYSTALSVFWGAFGIFIIMTAGTLFVFLPQINETGNSLDQFVAENKDQDLPTLTHKIRQFFDVYNYRHSYGKDEYVFEIDAVIFTNQIDKQMIEFLGVSRGELILYQHWGGCGQSALLTEEILQKCGYEVRYAKLIDLDHMWAETNYYGNWTIVDPWNTIGLFDIHNLSEYYPDYRNAKGVKVTYINGSTVEEFYEYGF